jgi:thioredoxin reductase/SAM-dependent methyltransferase
MTSETFFDVVVIGGGPAGLSGAVLLARSLRSVLVIDAGEPRNASAHAVHNFLSHEGVAPGELLALGRDEVRSYGGEIWSGRVVAARRYDDDLGFSVSLEDGRTARGRRLLVTTGLTDQLPDVPGVRERWGRDVLHCPYCHGWEVRDQTVGVLATGPAAVHMALLFRQLTARVVYFAHTAPALSPDQAAQFAARGIRVAEGSVASLEVRDDQLAGVELASGTRVGCQALVVTPRYVARAELLVGLGLKPEEHPSGFGEAIAADAVGRTEVPGVWVAGNVTDISAGVLVSAAGGTTAASQINAELVAEDTRLAMEVPDALRPDFWDARYAESDQIWSGNPNPQLVAQVSGRAPGTALDVGCGEGGDAVWLATRGWRVTAMDVSVVALERGAAAAARLGREVAERITWVRADVLTSDAGGERFDLVNAQYLHFTRSRAEVFRRLAELVRPDGTLLVVGHHPADVQRLAGPRHAHMEGFLFTADEVEAVLDTSMWQVVLKGEPWREHAAPHGDTLQIRDVVLLARRKPSPAAAGSATG